MKKLLNLALVASAISISGAALADESYSNFPTISSEFKTRELCQSWLGEKTAKYGERIIANASGCESVRVRLMSSGSTHAPSYKTIIKGTVVLDTL
jgi:hypothetical protein